jgi:hypothetical protein
MDGHKHDCQCLKCIMARGYQEMGEINLELSSTYQLAEEEAYQLAMSA